MISVSCRGDREYQFDPERTALIAIDMQQEFFADDSAECIAEMRAIIPRVARLLALARQLGCRVVHTRETYQPDLSDVHAYRRSLGYVGKPGPLGRFCILGEAGHDFVGAVAPLPGEPVIDKPGFSAFYRSELDALLQRDGIDHLILCGVTTQCCVHSTLREAVDRGYWCLTVADCCAATDAGMHDAALALIAGEGHLFGWVADLRELAAAGESASIDPNQT
jgi:nicotinamidase-related amidase